MKYLQPLKTGRLIKRYKRFLADIVDANGEEITIHCPNTGSMKNCMEPGSKVWYSTSDNPKRKYAYTWECVSSPDNGVIGINTGLSNKLVKQAIENGTISELQGYDKLRSEVRYGSQSSRIDFLLESLAHDKHDCYVEVKNVSLHSGSGVGLFPDSVTQRGQKHLRELMEVVERGQRAMLVFCVQHSKIESVSPADEIDSYYGELLREAYFNGVEVVAYKASFQLESDKIILDKSLPVLLDN